MPNAIQIRLPAGQVGKGMFVAKLDRPWTQAPFPFQGCLVEQ
jgi:hypothetical protein